MAFLGPEGSSKIRPLTFGEALAILAIEGSIANDNHGQSLSASAQSYLQALRERAKTMCLPENFAAVFEAMPVQTCGTEKTFLADNEDFFLAYFLASSNPAEDGNACLNLFRHLNVCFGCFEEFSTVMLNYYHKFQELSNGSDENMTN
jgi:hypothetical protein